jgi:hypothetical protein
MYRVPPDRAWWPAVGAPLERGVRPHSLRKLGECVIAVCQTLRRTRLDQDKPREGESAT